MHLRLLDEALFRFINQSLANPAGDFLFPIFNHAAPFIPLVALALLWLTFHNLKRYWIAALTCVLALILTDMLISNPLKKSIHRPRPAAILHDVRELASGATGGNAFPSSHTTNAFLVATILSNSFPRRRNLLMFFGAASLIAFSRIYVGVHYPSDVLGSAMLGVVTGWIAFRISGAIQQRRTQNTIRLAMAAGPGFVIGLPLAVLALIQIARLAWTHFSQLDVPVECARIWYAVHLAPDAAGFLTRWLGRCWFALFGSSALSLWAMPWAIQTVLVAVLAGLVARKQQVGALWGLVFVTATLPLISQLSFLGSPSRIFENSDWPLSLPGVAFFFYLILGLPLWIYALCNFRRIPGVSGCALAGMILAFSCPALPWLVPAVLSAGCLWHAAHDVGMAFQGFTAPSSGWRRVALVTAAGYGILLSVAVYNPRFLRKLDLSFLPRNSPHYLQTGWSDWHHRNQGKMTPPAEIWTDAESSKYVAQWYLGSSFKVRGPAEWAKIRPSAHVYYVHEVDFAQIHPQMIFVPRNPQTPLEPRENWREMDSFEVFRQGDPIRQFQLFYLPSGSAPGL